MAEQSAKAWGEFVATEWDRLLSQFPEMNVVMDVPVTLNGISVQDEYDGDFQTRRYVTHTLEFSLKVSLFGPTLTNTAILHSDVTVSTHEGEGDVATYEGDGDQVTYGITEAWTEDI